MVSTEMLGCVFCSCLWFSSFQPMGGLTSIMHVAQPDLKQNTSFHVKKNNNNKNNNNPTALAAHIQLYFGPWFP